MGAIALFVVRVKVCMVKSGGLRMKLLLLLERCRIADQGEEWREMSESVGKDERMDEQIAQWAMHSKGEWSEREREKQKRNRTQGL